MRRLVTGKQMKEIDSHGIKTVGIPSMVLMERAALACAEEVKKEYAAGGREIRDARALVLAGTGNNGADGAAIGRMLFLSGAQVTIACVGDAARQTEEMKQQLSIAENLGIETVSFSDYVPGVFDIAVDALFGVGLSREVEGEYAEAAAYLNRRKTGLVLAVDIPSGIDSETGQVLGCAVRADITVTFGFEKLGSVFYPGKEYAGRVVVADIGFPPFEDYQGKRYFTGEEKDLEKIPARKGDSHKGTYGRILIAAGSEGMCGAAYFSALAACRSGAGLVKILTVRANVPVLQTRLPEAMIIPYDPEQAEEEPETFRETVEEACAWASVIVLGPGLGHGRHVEQLLRTILLAAYVPIIVDADGLNAVAEYPYLADYFTENVIVTPHIGEMARLTGLEPEDIKADPVTAACMYSEEKGVICVLKDAVTVVARRDGAVFLGTSGCGAMAKGGSGDVLTGVIAGLLALDLPEDEAASMGVWIHGMAGRKAAERCGEHSVLASDIANAVMQF
ncbi:MAG: NAD(P)H-hydrate dehydratase [Clostridium sp.]|nr:NAD(P)H-hydrate dehydratase [Clostridium sp.]